MSMKTPNIVAALGQLVRGDVPIEDVIERCDQFYCMLLSSKAPPATDTATPRWMGDLSPNQGVDKLPPTTGAFRQHTLTAHL